MFTTARYWTVIKSQIGLFHILTQYSFKLRFNSIPLRLDFPGDPFRFFDWFFSILESILELRCLLTGYIVPSAAVRRLEAS